MADAKNAKETGSGCGGCLGLVMALAVIVFIVVAIAGGSSSSTTSTPEPASAPAAETEAQPAPPPAEPSPEPEKTPEPAGEEDEVGSASHAGDAQFCEAHECIGSFTTEEGTVVECSDGAYSHAGGISGACSHHGGEKE